MIPEQDDKIFNQSIFKRFFEKNDSDVVSWTDNVLDKMRFSGVAKYIKRFIKPNTSSLEDVKAVDTAFDNLYKPMITLWAYIVKLSIFLKTFRGSGDIGIEFSQQYMLQNGFYISFRESYDELTYKCIQWQQRFSAYRGTESSFAQNKGTVEGELLRLYGYSGGGQGRFAPFVAGIGAPHFNGLWMDKGGSLYKSLEQREDLNIINKNMSFDLFESPTALFKQSKERGFYYNGATAGNGSWRLTANLDRQRPYVLYFEIECMGTLRLNFKVYYNGNFFFEGKTPPLPTVIQDPNGPVVPAPTKSLMRYMFNIGNYISAKQLQLPNLFIQDPNDSTRQIPSPSNTHKYTVFASEQNDTFRRGNRVYTLPRLRIPASGDITFGIDIGQRDISGNPAPDPTAFTVQNIRLTPLRSSYGRSFVDVQKILDICARNNSTVYSDDELADIVREQFVPYNTALNFEKRWVRPRPNLRGIGYDAIEDNFQVG